MIKESTFRNLKRLSVPIILLIILILSAQAQPIPLGVEGTVYEQDGLTQVQSGTKFKVKNINNGYEIEGVTGIKGSGSFSAGVKGVKGDTIIITSWNKYNNVSETLALEGMIYNIRLFLNTTFPPIPPEILSVPELIAYEDTEYIYQLEAYDENHDPLEYRLEKGPDNMYLNELSGLLNWTPNQNDVGIHGIILQVTDGLFLENQSFFLEVKEVNDIPIILSQPPKNATVGIEYSYKIIAYDDDDNILFYMLDFGPDGMILNNQTIYWTPSKEQIGSNNAKVTVSDSKNSTSQNFNIYVNKDNSAPVILSLPITQALEDELYIYNVIASDEDNDTLNYSLINPPNNMIIESFTGKIRWTPGNNDVGIHNITIKVSDKESSVFQNYLLLVENANDPPIIISDPVTTAYIGRKYFYRVRAEDPDGDTVKFSLIKKPINMKIYPRIGLIVWRPNKLEKISNPVTVEASDGDLKSYQSFNITVRFPDDYFYYGKGSGDKQLDQDGFNDKNKLDTRINIEFQNGNIPVYIEEMSTRPEDTYPISKKVYRYLKIEKLEEKDFQNAEIKFSIKKSWVGNNNVGPGDIALSRFSSDKWTDLDTKFLREDKNYYHYSSITPGFSFFAITIKEGIESFENKDHKVSKIKIPYKLSGIFHEFGKIRQIPRDTKYQATNLNTNEQITGLTGLGSDTGAFFFIMHGAEGDQLEIKLENNDQIFKTDLKNNKNLEFIKNFDKNSLTSITGNAISDLFESSIGKSIVFISFIFIVSLIIIRFKYKKDA